MHDQHALARCPITLPRRVPKSSSRIFLIILAAHDTRHRGRETGATAALIGAARKSDSAYPGFFLFAPLLSRSYTKIMRHRENIGSLQMKDIRGGRERERKGE